MGLDFVLVVVILAYLNEEVYLVQTLFLHLGLILKVADKVWVVCEELVEIQLGERVYWLIRLSVLESSMGQ